tara:strand:+ start:1626 stop:2636 length:1011 start_codon:yes stop_codon:yes gene_type:complete
MKYLKLISINFVLFIIFILMVEIFFGYWFSENNFGIYMRKERRINWITQTNMNNQNYKFSYKRNFWGFRGDEFKPKDVKIVFQGGSTGNQRMHPEELTIVGQLNKFFKDDNIDFKIYNSSTDGKSLKGYINDFLFWFPKIPNFQPKYMIFFIGVNDTLKSNEKHWNYKVSDDRLGKIKDYVKNNSIFVDKFKIVKNKFFPRNILAYEPNSNNLYENFIYTNYNAAKTKNKVFDDAEKPKIINFGKELNKLNSILIEREITPIFITQVMYNGLENNELFNINNKLKKFAKSNGHFIIKLDELATMELNDFYDRVHTTPQGSRKIAKIIYPFLKEILN